MDERIKQEVAETDSLMREALKWGVEVPPGETMWANDVGDHGGTIEEIQEATRFSG